MKKVCFIISDKIEEIRIYILNDLHRGGSIVPYRDSIIVQIKNDYDYGQPSSDGYFTTSDL